MQIISKKSNLLSSNFYILVDQGKSVFIDPAVIDIGIELKAVDYIFLTHEHYDHISGTNYWKGLYPNVKVVCSLECYSSIINPSKNLSVHFDAFCQLQTWIKEQKLVPPIRYSCDADILFSKYMRILWNNHIIEMYHTPGHSIGSCVYIVDNKMMFSGDTIFSSYPTFTSLYKNGRRDFLYNTLPLIRSMDDNIKIYPGHFEPFLMSQMYYKGDVGT